MENMLQKADLLTTQYPYLKTILLSVLLLLFYQAAKWGLNASMNRSNLDKADNLFFKKKLQVYLRYFFLLTLFVLWFAKLQVFLVSVFAIAAAIVLAFKELIMCLTGGLLIRSAKTFEVGHRIDVNGTRGFVLEKNLLTTRLLELGPEKNSQQTTGDVITIPNSVMLSQVAKNESYFKGYSIKSFYFRIYSFNNLDSFEEILLSEANEITKDYLEKSKQSISKFCAKEGIAIPSLSPRTKVLIEDNKTYVLVKLPVKNDEVADTEQRLNRLYANWVKETDSENKIDRK